MTNLIVQSYQGDVTVAPNLNLREYTKLLNNCTPEDYFKALPQVYVQSLRKMSRIKSLFAIEREFDRFYNLLKC